MSNSQKIELSSEGKNDDDGGQDVFKRKKKLSGKMMVRKTLNQEYPRRSCGKCFEAHS